MLVSFHSYNPHMHSGKDNTGVTDRVVNQLLTFIDGVEDTMGSATTNGSERFVKPRIF